MKLRILACISVLLMVGIAAAPAANAAAPSRYVISVSTPSATMSLGGSLKVTGTVRGAGATRVTLYQLSGKRWVAWRSAGVVAGRYAVYYKPVTPGGHTIRVITPATKKHAAGGSASKTVTVYKWHYLSDFANTSRLVANEFGYAEGVSDINGHTYLHTPSDSRYSVGDKGYAEYNLSRACWAVQTTAGLTDESPTGGTAELAIQTDGVERWAKTMSPGQSQSLSLSVRGNLRLRLADTVVTSDRNGHDILSAFGNARVLCRF